LTHSVSFTIDEGNWIFNGVECELYLDEFREGAGGEHVRLAASYGNAMSFSVDTEDGGEAWALATCPKDNDSNGFSFYPAQ